ncbi:MAG: nucleotidyltransferase family protein [Alphaproteobacteria bacterium]|nr:nucleotidyltransferase family protein [Alphaproteobacteria bacterium]
MTTPKNPIERAFILTAGQGTRLRPYTDTLPKPLVPVRGEAILGHTLQKLKNFGIKHVTFNLHYLGDRIENYVTQNHSELSPYFSHEDVLLNTGGGVKKALHSIKGEDFFLINGDALWDDIPDQATALEQLAGAWNPDKMDILLLLQPLKNMALTQGVGDYDVTPDGKVVRSLNKSGACMFTGIRITSPKIFETAPDGAFSYRDLIDKAQTQGRLHSVIYDGQWHHISTPEDLERVNKAAGMHVQQTEADSAQKPPVQEAQAKT